ncbi:sensor histidine kinase [Streptomyces sioyaensis]|uniref:sensor histidine kinase n=1 Tax=Streptomyces sioyaensis TaxID=67364 RepID=UPI003D7432D2
MAQTWEAKTVQHTKQQDACAPGPGGAHGSDSGGARGTDSGPCRPRWAERKADEGPGKYAFLPWLLMGMGAFSNVIEGKTGNPWLAGLGLLAFNSVYITVVWTSFNPRLRHSRRPLYALGVLTAITFAIALGFGGDWFLFFPLLSLASGTVRALRGKKLAAWLIALSGAAGYLTGWHNGGPGAFGVGYGTFLSGTVTATVLSLFDTIQELNTTRQELARSAVEKERLRFSRDLHDLLGHTLSVVVVKAEAVRRLAPRNLDAALAQAADIEAVGRQALTEIREAVSGYREGSLSTELDRARSVLEAAGIEPVVRQAGPPLPPQAGALLGWVVREGVTNAVRHSGATHCEISVHADEERVRLTLTDDGRGPGGSGAGGTGLKGLTERLAAAGGTLRSGPDGRRGFRVTAELPVGTGDMAGAEEPR